MSIDCPICHGSSSPWRAVGQLPIYRCDNCFHHFHPIDDERSHISKVYGDQYFVGSDEGYQDYVAEEQIQRRSARFYLDLIARYSSPPGRALDIGAACGFLCDQFQSSGWNCVGVEPNQRMRDLAAERYRLEMVESVEVLLESSASSQLDHSSFQLATMIQVLSHIPQPRAAIRSVHSMLDKNGLLLIETWDRQSWIARLSGKKWHEWNPPSVLHWFTRASLRKLIDEEGFDLIAQGLPRKRIQIGRAFHLLRHAWRESLFVKLMTAPLGLIPEKFAIPYLLGDAFWLLARKR